MINVDSPANVIIDVVIGYHNLLLLIVSDQGSIFTSKFSYLLWYFFAIKQKPFNAFYLQMNN